MYRSRLMELNAERGDLDAVGAAVAHQRYVLGAGVDHVEELTYPARRRIHNLKYYTWVEQQGKTYDEIQRQWYDDRYWTSIPEQASHLDALIEDFNARTGLG
jgi:hypothetical protein